ncbi:MAG: pyridoxal phosphate-dependent aminotransferase [Rhodobacteraceae bacterium]|nr:pyridoxal phosphate-dependent aminotransferase [Paracoccaceae bacterium]
MSDPRLTPLVASLPATVPFVGPEALERTRGVAFRARLGANESVFGPSPAAVQAMARAAQDTWMYADPEAHDLRHAIAAHHGVDPAHVMVGEGIDGLLGLLVRLTVEPGTPVVTSDGAYPTFNYHVAGFGGGLTRVPYRNDAEDLPALLSRAAEVGARLVYFANPDNPMGSWHGGATVEAALDAIPDGTTLILDEAYIDLAPPDTAPRIDPADLRVIRMRTFSKGHGLAGARVGYAIGAAPLIAAFDRVRNHFGMSRMGQAGALAALADTAWLAHVQAQVTAARTRIAAIGASCGLTALPSATNFVTLDCGADAALARRVLDETIARGVFIRMPFAAPGNRCIRISCGRPADLDLLAEVLPQAVAAARAVRGTVTGA